MLKGFSFLIFFFVCELELLDMNKADIVLVYITDYGWIEAYIDFLVYKQKKMLKRIYLKKKY